jgi:hypothetical protein
LGRKIVDKYWKLNSEFGVLAKNGFIFLVDFQRFQICSCRNPDNQLMA